MVPAQVVAAQAGLEEENEVETTMVMVMTLTNAGRQGVKVNHQKASGPERTMQEGHSLPPG